MLQALTALATAAPLSYTPVCVKARLTEEFAAAAQGDAEKLR